MLSSFSSWVAASGEKKNCGRAVVIGDHYPAINESVRKRHWKALSKAIEEWCAEDTERPFLILGETCSGAQKKLPLNVPTSDSSNDKRESKIDARQKAELAVLSQHLRAKLVQHASFLETDSLLLNSGDQVEISGLLSAPQFNGKIGTITKTANDAGRYEVKIPNEEKPFLLRRSNLKKTVKEKVIEGASSVTQKKCTVSLADTYDLAYLASFVVLAIKFWRPVGINANEREDGDRIIRFIKHSHDVTWSQLFHQVTNIISFAKRTIGETEKKEVKECFQSRLADLESAFTEAKKFSAKFSEDEDERYCLTFFAAVKAEGDAALKLWCSWADKMAYSARDLCLFYGVFRALKQSRRVLIIVENNIALSLVELLSKSGLKCAHFAGTMARFLPNQTPPAASKFDDGYLQKVIPSAFEMDEEGAVDTKSLLQRMKDSNSAEKSKRTNKSKKKRGGKKGRPKR